MNFWGRICGRAGTVEVLKTERESCVKLSRVFERKETTLISLCA